MKEKIRKIKNFFEKGTADVLAFIVMGPIIIVIFAALVNIITLGEIRTQMEYATYTAGHAAMCSTSYDAAVNNALQIAKENLAPYAQNIDGGLDEGVTVSLRKVNAKTGKTTSNVKDSDWEKGQYYRIRLKVKYKSVESVFGSSNRNCYMIMAVEYDDPYDYNQEITYEREY